MARRPEAIAVLGRAVRTPRGTAGLVIAGLVILVAVIGPAVAPYSSHRVRDGAVRPGLERRVARR